MVGVEAEMLWWKLEVAEDEALHGIDSEAH